MSHGVRIFRVDNPHTKPLQVLGAAARARSRQTDPDVLFLAEAFTRPAMMATLAKVGFHQSYTYFTWRNTEGGADRVPAPSCPAPPPPTCGPTSSSTRPTSCTRTCSTAGRAAFKIRAVLARCCRPTWGVYSGYELCENIPLRPGSEEYLDSEKYQYRPRDWDAAARDGLGHRAVHHDLNESGNRIWHCTGCAIYASITWISRS